MELGGYEDRPLGYLGAGLFFLALVLSAGLERLQLGLRTKEKSAWWASNGRDVANALALAVMWLGLGAVGFSGPLCLVVAASLVILQSLVESLLTARPRLSYLLQIAVGALAGVPVLLFPRLVDRLFRQLVVWLF